MNVRSLVPLLCLFVSGGLLADDLTLAPIIYRFDYRDFDQARSAVDDEDEAAPGLEASLRSGFSENWYGSGGLRWVRGSADYNGKVGAGSAPRSSSDEELLQLNAMIGRCFNGCRSPYSLFAGLSRWDWQRDKPSGADVAASDNYNWWELEFGGGASYRHSSAGSLDFGLSGLWVYDPDVKVDLNDINFNDSSLALEGRPGVRARIFWRNPGAASSAFRWGAGITYERWDAGSDQAPVSNGNGSTVLIREPDSRTESIFFQANMTWLFE